MKPEVYAFFLDIDGTLWVNGNIPPINISTIEQVREQGHKVLINTGRSYGYIPQSLFERIKFDGVVSGIGASVIIDGRYVEKSELSADEIKKLFAFFKGKKKWLVFEGEEKVLFYHEDYEKIKEKKELGSDFFVNGDPNHYYLSSEEEWKSVFGCTPIAKLTVDDYAPTEEEEKILSENFSVIPHYEAKYTEIGIKGYDKGIGMLKACKYLGIDADHCVAMGDSANDIGMLKRAGISVAMGNASRSVKEIADIVTVSCMDGGVACAMEKIINKE